MKAGLAEGTRWCAEDKGGGSEKEKIIVGLARVGGYYFPQDTPRGEEITA